MSDAWNKEMKNVARVMEQGMISFVFFNYFGVDSSSKCS